MKKRGEGMRRDSVGDGVRGKQFEMTRDINCIAPDINNRAVATCVIRISILPLFCV